MNNLSSYCGLVDAKKGASDKDLPVFQLSFTNNLVNFGALLLLNDRFSKVITGCHDSRKF